MITMKGSAMRSHGPTGDERRDLALNEAAIDIRTDANGQPRFFGHAAVFNIRTAIGNPLTWGFYEQIAPGTFTKTLSEGDQRFLIDHASYYVVARSSAGTLNHYQDTRGLVNDSALDTNLSYVNDLIANLRNGNITGMSFGFRVTKDDWSTEPAVGADGQALVDPDGNAITVDVRTVREVQLFESSCVTFPAYEETDAGLRHSLIPALRRRDDRDAIERCLRYRPELRSDLLPATVVDLKSHGGDEALPGEVLGNDTPIVADANAMIPTESSEGEPAETTRTEDEHDPAEPEPAASTRRALRRELAAARTEALRRRLSISAA